MTNPYTTAAARAMSDRIDYGWDETLPRTPWQRLLRRPAMIVHHYGLTDIVTAFEKEIK